MWEANNGEASMNYNQYIDEACEKFRSLLVSQLERQNRINTDLR